MPVDVKLLYTLDGVKQSKQTTKSSSTNSALVKARLAPEKT